MVLVLKQTKEKHQLCGRLEMVYKMGEVEELHLLTKGEKS